MLERPASDRYDVVLEAFRKGASVDDVRERTAIDPWFLEELRALALDPDAALAGERSYKAVDTCAAEFPARTPYYYSGLGAARRARGRARRAPERRHPRQRAQPHRPGHRVRLLLRARRHDRPRVRPRRGDDQLQPRDGLHRLRHLRSPVLRAADPRGRPRRHRDRAARGRRRPVRRPDAAQARPRPAGGRRPDPRHERRQHRPRRGPRALRGAARAPGLPGAALRHGALGRRGPRRSPRRSASRCSCAPATCSAGGRWRSSTRATGLADYLHAAHARDGRADLPRPLPGERDRGRRRRPVRRRGGLDRRDHAARRGGRHPLRRLGLRAAPALAGPRDARRDPRGDDRHRARPRASSGS